VWCNWLPRRSVVIPNELLNPLHEGLDAALQALSKRYVPIGQNASR